MRYAPCLSRATGVFELSHDIIKHWAWVTSHARGAAHTRTGPFDTFQHITSTLFPLVFPISNLAAWRVYTVARLYEKVEIQLWLFSQQGMKCTAQTQATHETCVLCIPCTFLVRDSWVGLCRSCDDIFIGFISLCNGRFLFIMKGPMWPVRTTPTVCQFITIWLHY